MRHTWCYVLEVSDLFSSVTSQQVHVIQDLQMRHNVTGNVDTQTQDSC
jgi:hypothetical protein